MEVRAIVGMIGGGTIPLIVAAVTMLAMISLRNGHLAERARGNVDEALYKLPTSELSSALRARRFEQLKAQGAMFEKRYRRGSTAFLIMSLALVALVAAATANAAGRSLAIVDCAPLLGSVGAALFAWSLTLVLIEVHDGTRTLELNGAILAESESAPIATTPPRPPA